MDLVLYLFLCDFFQVSLLWCPNTAVFTRFTKEPATISLLKLKKKQLDFA